MTQLFGDPATFAVEIGDFWSAPHLRVVDLWAGGRRLTVEDNVAYLPAFCRLMRWTVDQVRGDRVPARTVAEHGPEETFQLLHEDDEQSFRFLNWGETVDNVVTYAYLDGDLVLLFSFWRPTHPVLEERGKALSARIAPDEFVSVVNAAADVLEAAS
ncbi:hypothetical protein [Actinoplanes sp. NPDC020271]|uniref:hypothetical protein n=1 Tax=Actinoplanes sp. NPDC020271 TaxID=3363896 RepID=UPI00379B40BE